MLPLILLYHIHRATYTVITHLPLEKVKHWHSLSCVGTVFGPGDSLICSVPNTHTKNIVASFRFKVNFCDIVILIVWSYSWEWEITKLILITNGPHEQTSITVPRSSLESLHTGWFFSAFFINVTFILIKKICGGVYLRKKWGSAGWHGGQQWIHQSWMSTFTVNQAASAYK